MKITVEQMAAVLEALAMDEESYEGGLYCTDDSHSEEHWSAFVAYPGCAVATICAACLVRKLEEASDE